MNVPQNFWKFTTALITILIAFVAIISIKEIKSVAYVGANPDQTNTITVNGTGDAVGKPDVASFTFTVNETGATVPEAQTKATEKLNNALKAVRDAGVQDKDILTSSYTINPHYEYQNGVCTTGGICKPSKSILTGYDVSQGIQVKVRELSKAGAIFTSIGSLGVQNIGDLQFSVDKPEAIQAEARAKAISDAKSKADELAKQLGVRLVRISSFYESNDRGPIAYGMGGYAKDMAVSQAMPAANPPEVPSGEHKVTDNVTITYEIR
jgi:uncharacterized protein YggE